MVAMTMVGKTRMTTAGMTMTMTGMTMAGKTDDQPG